jgi:hypothetical protein
MQTLAEDSPTAAEEPAADLDDIPDEIGPAPFAASLLLVAGLWLAATMWSAHATLVGLGDDAAVVVSSAALALPGAITASLLFGAAGALAAADRFAGRGPGARLRRLLVGLGAGAVAGAGLAGLILAAYGGGSAIVAIALTVASAAVLAGVAGAVLPPAPVAAGLAGSLVAAVVGVVLTLFQSPLTAMFGAGDTVYSLWAAAERLSYTAAAVSGLVAAAVAYVFLRWLAPDVRWPGYLLGGAFAGLVLCTAELITRIGGASLLGVVQDLSRDDEVALAYLGGARIRNALIVSFVGGIGALIAVGRTLRPRETPDPD